MAHPNPDVFERLIRALDGLAHGLEQGVPEAVLAAEEPLADATDALTRADLVQLARRPDIHRAVLDVRLAMARCQALGATARDLAAIISPGDYGPAGLQRRPRRAARTMGTRT